MIIPQYKRNLIIKSMNRAMPNKMTHTTMFIVTWAFRLSRLLAIGYW